MFCLWNHLASAKRATCSIQFILCTFASGAKSGRSTATTRVNVATRWVLEWHAMAGVTSGTTGRQKSLSNCQRESHSRMWFDRRSVAPRVGRRR
jgi:hypothetical protein